MTDKINNTEKLKELSENFMGATEGRDDHLDSLLQMLVDVTTKAERASLCETYATKQVCFRFDCSECPFHDRDNLMNAILKLSEFLNL